MVCYVLGGEREDFLPLACRDCESLGRAVGMSLGESILAGKESFWNEVLVGAHGRTKLPQRIRALLPLVGEIGPILGTQLSAIRSISICMPGNLTARGTPQLYRV